MSHEQVQAKISLQLSGRTFEISLPEARGIYDQLRYLFENGTVAATQPQTSQRIPLNSIFPEQKPV